MGNWKKRQRAGALQSASRPNTPVFQSGVALIVWIGVLAVVAILLAFLLPALLREIDFDVARAESATLKTLDESLQHAIQHKSVIPSDTTWAQMVSAETGMSLAAITNNVRHQPRILVLDSGGWLSNNVPYAQNWAGSPTLPLKARVMLATSLGKPLPITSGFLDANSFANLWNAPEGSVPTNAPWSTWGGKPDDVKLERINLMPLFVTVYLSSYASATNGAYSVGSDPGAYWAPFINANATNTPHYYLMGTTLRLYDMSTNGTPILDSTQLLTKDGSFVYEENVWKSSAAGGVFPSGVDISGVVAAFLNSIPNVNAQNGANQQKLVVLSMMNYMSNYMAWANGGFSDNNLKTYLKGTVQPNMMGTVQALFMGTYYATNPAPCQ